MTREQHLAYCKICTHQKFDPKLGIICDLTDKQADFEGECPSFEADQEQIKKEEAKVYSNFPKFRTASAGKRFANFLIDLVILYILTFMFAFTVAMILAAVYPDALKYMVEGNVLLNYGFAFVVWSLYYGLLEGGTGRSIGKFVTKTKVVDMNGNIPSYGAIFKRTLSRFIPFEAFSFLGSDAVGWHDQISDTRVVEIDPPNYQQF